jgi:hypothetical protein
VTGKERDYGIKNGQLYCLPVPYVTKGMPCRCKKCKGVKVVKEKKKVEFMIDPGTEDGERIALSGEGDEAVIRQSTDPLLSLLTGLFVWYSLTYQLVMSSFIYAINPILSSELLRQVPRIYMLQSVYA